MKKYTFYFQPKEHTLVSRDIEKQIIKPLNQNEIVLPTIIMAIIMTFFIVITTFLLYDINFIILLVIIYIEIIFLIIPFFYFLKIKGKYPFVYYLPDIFIILLKYLDESNQIKSFSLKSNKFFIGFPVNWSSIIIGTDYNIVCNYLPINLFSKKGAEDPNNNIFIISYNGDKALMKNFITKLNEKNLIKEINHKKQFHKKFGLNTKEAYNNIIDITN